MLIGSIDTDEGSLRLGLLGSCRLHDPVKAAFPNFGGRFEWSAHNAFTHSPPEVVQHVDFCLGRLEIPDPFVPYILKQEHVPLLEPRLADLASSCDVFVIEISSFDLLRCGTYFFNADYFAQTFIRGKGSALLDWYRELSDRPPPPAVAAEAEASLDAAGQLTPSRIEILRTLRKEEITDARVHASLSGLASLTKRLVLMPIFNVPGQAEAVFAKRAGIADRVKGAAERLGAAYIDPSPLIAEAGKESALDGGGADPFHYAPGFLSVAGNALLKQIVASAEGVGRPPDLTRAA